MHTSTIAGLEAMRRYFHSGATRTYAFRKQQLEKLKEALLQNEKALHDALATDLNRSPEESWVTETGFVLSEINATIKHLRQWMQPEKAETNLVNLPSTSYVMREPLGVVLVIGPWNYPFQLLFNPLVGAMAAGNCVMLKASEFAPATAKVMARMIRENFSPEYISFTDADGGTIVPQMMNNFTFDHVFYTGSTAIGKIIYKMAAERLVPVTLELGGKSPCVVENDANLNVAIRRIAMAKFSNAGQMCVAPDYVLVHADVKEQFVSKLKQTLLKFFTDKAEENYDYGRIINAKQFDRLVSYLSQGTIVHGGRHMKERLFIEPTVLDNVPIDAPVMNEEIFGPILPVIAFKSMEEAKKIIERHPNPLSFYIYSSSSSKQQQWLEQVAAGGVCINNSSWHLTNHNLPFGGRGFSGTGKYHGKYSFDTFSHQKAVMKTPTWFDPDIKYPPLKGRLKIFKWVIR